MSQQSIIEATSLTKSYGDFIAVNELNLRIDEGEIFGFLGPNGAGKTTTMLMLLGLTEPTSGNVMVCGYNSTREPLNVKRVVGYLPEKVGFYKELTARQNLDYIAALNGLSRKEASKRIEEILDSVGLSEVVDKKVGEFSQGMRQRLGIADVMIKDPKIAFFDEPTSGIDPKGTGEILGLISKMAKRNVTVVLSSHQLHHVQKICNRVAIFNKGCVVAEGSIEQLGRDAVAGGKFRIEVQVSPVTRKLVNDVKKVNGVLGVETSGDSLSINSDKDLRSQVAKIIVDSGSLLIQMKLEEYGLDEIYKKYFREAGS